MIAITTSNSIRVNPPFRLIVLRYRFNQTRSFVTRITLYITSFFRLH